jgi:GNAT superfamily N-acetyltransferase
MCFSLFLFHSTGTCKRRMELKYTSPFNCNRGIVAKLLKKSYSKLVETEPDSWAAEKDNWDQFDHDVFDNPKTIGACTFLSWIDSDLVGLFSYDSRARPAYGLIGHNCILPEYRNRGFGKQQIYETLGKFKKIGIKQARVSTNDHPFFIPAQRMYTACGFIEVKRVPWDRDHKQKIIHYEMDIG